MTALPGQAQRIASRHNPQWQEVRRLAQDNGAYRQAQRLWIEGEHLCRAYLAAGGQPQQVWLTDAAAAQPALAALAAQATQSRWLDEPLFAQLSPLPAPVGIGFVVALPTPPKLDLQASSLVLDRVQDAGNVGSILRSAAAFGVSQVLALPGTAGLWSPKVLRAAMGAHFSLALHEAVDAATLARLQSPFIATSSHAKVALHEANLPSAANWVFGHEGQGVAPELLARCSLQLRIPQPGGQESLNVAAAAAVCLYEAARLRARTA